MAQPRARAWRIAQHLAVPTLAVAVVALLPLAKPGAPEQSDRWTPLTPANVSFSQKTGPTTSAQLLGFNDFHGNIDPPLGELGHQVAVAALGHRQPADVQPSDIEPAHLEPPDLEPAHVEPARRQEGRRLLRGVGRLRPQLPREEHRDEWVGRQADAHPLRVRQSGQRPVRRR